MEKIQSKLIDENSTDQRQRCPKCVQVTTDSDDKQVKTESKTSSSKVALSEMINNRVPDKDLDLLSSRSSSDKKFIDVVWAKKPTKLRSQL